VYIIFGFPNFHRLPFFIRNYLKKLFKQRMVNNSTNTTEQVHLKPQTIKHKKHDISRWKSWPLFGTGIKMWRC